MDSYTITITPNDDSGNRTTLTVDTASGQARITSVHMHAPDGLTGAQLPSVDVGLLLQAVAGDTLTPAAITGTPTPVAEAVTHDADEPSTRAETETPPSATDVTTSPSSDAAPAKRAGRRPARARRGRSQPPAKKAAPGKTVRKRAAGTPAPAAAGSGERVYRRMPDDFAAVYAQTGTTAAIADHYGVPRYTAQGWVGRHKKQDAAGRN